LNTNGQITFQKIFRQGLCALGSYVFQTNDGGYIMAGDCFTNGLVSLIKTDVNGLIVSEQDNVMST
jgi:hypothetical protein